LSTEYKELEELRAWRVRVESEVLEAKELGGTLNLSRLDSSTETNTLNCRSSNKHEYSPLEAEQPVQEIEIHLPTFPHSTSSAFFPFFFFTNSSGLVTPFTSALLSTLDSWDRATGSDGFVEFFEVVVVQAQGILPAWHSAWQQPCLVVYL